MTRVPVIILSGFLGSGKTTLLLNLLEETQKRNLKYSVLINEFGSYDIDGAIISNETNKQKVETLLDGCICCTKKSEVSLSIEKLLQKKPDVIFVELTGLANPEEVVDTLSERILIAKVYIDKIVSILDAEMLNNAESFNRNKEFESTFKSQITFADMLIVNKMDLVSVLEKNKIKNILREQNKAATIEFTEYSRIHYESFFSRFKYGDHQLEDNNQIKNQENQMSIQKNDMYHHSFFSHITTIALPVIAPIEIEKIEAFLNKNKQIIRSKGFLPAINDNRTYIMQHVRKRTAWNLIEQKNDHYVVIIGIDLDERQLKEDWLNLWEDYQKYFEQAKTN